MIEVVNMKYGFGNKPGDVRCDRETKWGNPFILYYQKDRDKVCDLYEDYLDAVTTPGNKALVAMMLRLGGLSEPQVSSWMAKTGGYLDISELFEARRLGCWCSPRRCHCDTLKRVIESKVTPSLEADKR
jgi:hypothetical protein